MIAPRLYQVLAQRIPMSSDIKRFAPTSSSGCQRIQHSEFCDLAGLDRLEVNISRSPNILKAKSVQKICKSPPQAAWKQELDRR